MGLWTTDARITSLEPGQVVRVFRRQCQDNTGCFTMQPNFSGSCRPRVGRTDFWTDAVVVRAWDVREYQRHLPLTWIEVHWSHPIWYNKCGRRFHSAFFPDFTSRVLPEQVRLETEADNCRPRLSLVHIRWVGHQELGPGHNKGPLQETGCGSTSSEFIAGLESELFAAVGPDYEVISVFVQSSAELERIAPQALRRALRGRRIGACYFLWPIDFQDGHGHPTFVNRVELLRLMVRMEAAGIPTRFPHPSHLYRIFGGKEWAAQTCLLPPLHSPLTVVVPRQAIISNPQAAATRAVAGLARLRDVRVQWRATTGENDGIIEDGAPFGGVAKLGWSWEAVDVIPWDNSESLAIALDKLLSQPGCLAESVLVQEWVDFDVELRCFVVEADLAQPESWKPSHVAYTAFEPKIGCDQPGGGPRKFKLLSREDCLRQYFGDDADALRDAESRVQQTIQNWLGWLQAQSHELPVVIRFDFLVKHLGRGKARVTTGELTELGGCIMGWEDGQAKVFAAMIRSLLKEEEDCKDRDFRPTGETTSASFAGKLESDGCWGSCEETPVSLQSLAPKQAADQHLVAKVPTGTWAQPRPYARHVRPRLC